MILLEPRVFGFLEAKEQALSHHFEAFRMRGIGSEVCEFPGVVVEIEEFEFGAIQILFDTARADHGGFGVADALPQAAVEGVNWEGVFGFPG